MTPEQIDRLRAPFLPDEVGKLPRITCGDCSKKQCNQHKPSRCNICGNWITTAHLHLDYVGHADITNRLLDTDPEWTWEPVADPASLGLLSLPGGMWIRLTIGGVTRLGYGDAGDKKGHAAVKEAIGDALRNAAMRFGVALSLWAKGDREWAKEGGAAIDADEPDIETPAPAQPPPPASAAQSDADGLREVIAAFAKDRGWELRKVKTAFAREFRTNPEQATVEQLEQFLASLRQEAAAEEAPAGSARGAA